MDDDLKLGGNIELSGFKVVSRAEMVVVKKIVGSYARKFSDNVTGYESLKLNVKEVHKSEGSGKYEVHAMLSYNGKVESTEITERNIFVCVDSVLKKLESALL